MIAYFDCAFGLTPDAALGALLDLGVGVRAIESGLSSLKLGCWRLRSKKVSFNAIGCTEAAFHFKGEIPHVGSPARVLSLLRRSALPVRVKSQAEKAYRLLAHAEARVHRLPMDKVHFHEVGRATSILRVTGTLLALHILGIEEVYASPLPFANGTRCCDHGLLPLPSPATIELLRGVAFRPAAGSGELVTPSAAAFLRTVVKSFGPPPSMTLFKAGYGSGREILCRVLLGEVHDG